MPACPDPTMHPAGYQTAHCLPAAGVRLPLNRDVYRFNRAVPMFESDPCIRPNTGEFICQSTNCGQGEIYDSSMQARGHRPEDSHARFQFPPNDPQAQHTADPTARCRCPLYKDSPFCASRGPVTDMLQCPCTNRCRPNFLPPCFGHQDGYPGCVDRCDLRSAPCRRCRTNRLKGYIWDCPGAGPSVGPKMAMFLECDNPTNYKIVSSHSTTC